MTAVTELFSNYIIFLGWFVFQAKVPTSLHKAKFAEKNSKLSREILFLEKNLNKYSLQIRLQVSDV